MNSHQTKSQENKPQSPMSRELARASLLHGRITSKQQIQNREEEEEEKEEKRRRRNEK